MQILDNTLVQIVIAIAIFLVLTVLTKLIYNKLKYDYKSVKINKILPGDEVHSLRQVYYLILMALCVVNILYTLTVADIDFPYLAIFDIALSLYFTLTLDMSSGKNKILWLLLIPYGSLSYLLFNSNYMILLNIIHILAFIYFAKWSFDKFMEYTNSNGLGVTIILLFVIIFAGFFITQHSENVNPLDSLVIVSNQFTGNGYSVFGATIPGKMNSLLLVWGGYVMSGVSAATLTAAILIRHFKKEFKELKELIEEGDE